MSDWQMIKTAPRDGTNVLGCTANHYTPRTVRWHSANGTGITGASGWKFCGSETWAHPTHWMPLPEPPAPRGKTMSETKRYWIEVRGFDGHYVKAKSAGAARYADYRAYVEAGYGRGISFREFLGKIETFHHLGSPHPIEDTI